MKFFLSSILILFAISLTSQKLAYTYPDLDRKLIKLLEVSGNKDLSESQLAFIDVYNEWKELRKSLSGWHYSMIDLDAFNQEIDKVISMVEYSLEQKKLRYVESFTYQLIWEFKMLRDCVLIEGYPLDELLDMVNTYIEIKNTVNDQLFELREWFEFEDLICEFSGDMDLYKGYDEPELKNFFPNLDIEKHNQLLEKLIGCYLVFSKSLESGYQSDFVIPCDEMGEALNELIRLFKYNTKTI